MKREGCAEGQQALHSQKRPVDRGTIPYFCTSYALSGFRVVPTSC